METRAAQSEKCQLCNLFVNERDTGPTKGNLTFSSLDLGETHLDDEAVPALEGHAQDVQVTAEDGLDQLPVRTAVVAHLLLAHLVNRHATLATLHTLMKKKTLTPQTLKKETNAVKGMLKKECCQSYSSLLNRVGHSKFQIDFKQKRFKRFEMF